MTDSPECEKCHGKPLNWPEGFGRAICPRYNHDTKVCSDD